MRISSTAEKGENFEYSKQQNPRGKEFLTSWRRQIQQLYLKLMMSLGHLYMSSSRLVKESKILLKMVSPSEPQSCVSKASDLRLIFQTSPE
ncbi:hypothetical protein TNCT_736351 [Trichonephila clavata]|uniref:Uncharacterized protein n=1 Tax=Trichonephila clavata TaxID=2740835 RepID=A0A8X6L6D5_TRICU|nr:hypothetical protein TNCT_736351 [Trichonephila clavata]